MCVFQVRCIDFHRNTGERKSERAKMTGDNSMDSVEFELGDHGGSEKTREWSLTGGHGHS
jgi:hypothetical protein